MLNKLNRFAQKCAHDDFRKKIALFSSFLLVSMFLLDVRDTPSFSMASMHCAIVTPFYCSAHDTFVVDSNCVWLISMPLFLYTHILHNIFCYRFGCTVRCALKLCVHGDYISSLLHIFLLLLLCARYYSIL